MTRCSCLAPGQHPDRHPGLCIETIAACGPRDEFCDECMAIVAAEHAAADACWREHTLPMLAMRAATLPLRGDA